MFSTCVTTNRLNSICSNTLVHKANVLTFEDKEDKTVTSVKFLLWALGQVHKLLVADDLNWDNNTRWWPVRVFLLLPSIHNILLFKFSPPFIKSMYSSVKKGKIDLKLVQFYLITCADSIWHHSQNLKILLKYLLICRCQSL